MRVAEEIAYLRQVFAPVRPGGSYKRRSLEPVARGLIGRGYRREVVAWLLGVSMPTLRRWLA